MKLADTSHRWACMDAFVAVADAHSFTRAAERMGVSVSYVSRQIAGLEAQLGAKLLVRTTRKVALTETGRLFEEKCRSLIEARDAAFSAVSTGADEMSGPLRVTCSVGFSEKTIIPLLNAFVKRNPNIRLQVEVTNQMLDLVVNGFDMAIRTGHQEDVRLEAVQLATRSLLVCASPDYLETHGAPESVSSLDSHACLLGTSEIWRFNENRRAINFRPKGYWRCNNGFGVVDAALQGLGVCQLPDFYVRGYLESGELAEVLEAFRPAAQPIWAAFPKRTQKSARIRALLEYLAQSDWARAGAVGA